MEVNKSNSSGYSIPSNQKTPPPPSVPSFGREGAGCRAGDGGAATAAIHGRLGQSQTPSSCIEIEGYS
jgi:hypothetical protein